MSKQPNSSHSLAAAITKSASKQTYYTIRFFVDRPRVGDAYRAYAYFRWVDDVVDAESGNASEKAAFLDRQRCLLNACYSNQLPEDLCAEERMLVDLVQNDTEEDSGLQSYLRNMMGVMRFDVSRRGKLITKSELADYSCMLATAVTEALHYFIGHDDPKPCKEIRYLAVTGAHITHMLRDTYEDAESGYFNIPHEYLQKHGIEPDDLISQAYQEWVYKRVRLARSYFHQGRQSMSQVKNLRCRLAGYAYTARFEWILRAIGHDNYRLRPDYSERKSLKAGLWMAWSTLIFIFIPRSKTLGAHHYSIPQLRVEKP